MSIDKTETGISFALTNHHDKDEEILFLCHSDHFNNCLHTPGGVSMTASTRYNVSCLQYWMDEMDVDWSRRPTKANRFDWETMSFDNAYRKDSGFLYLKSMRINVSSTVELDNMDYLLLKYEETRDGAKQFHRDIAGSNQVGRKPPKGLEFGSLYDCVIDFAICKFGLLYLTVPKKSELRLTLFSPQFHPKVRPF